jgi:hypothetical protein
MGENEAMVGDGEEGQGVNDGAGAPNAPEGESKLDVLLSSLLPLAICLLEMKGKYEFSNLIDW